MSVHHILLVFYWLQALMILTEMLRDQRGAKLRSFVLPAIGEMLSLIATQVCVLLTFSAALPS